MPKRVTIGWLGAAPTEPIYTHDISNDADCSKEVPFGDLIDEKSFHGGISLPQNFQRAFYMQIEKVE
jgi:hypothetical protein